MKKLWMILVALIVTVAASGCGSRNVAPPMTISGTIRPVALIAQAIAGTSLQVQVLAGDDGSPLQNAQELVSRSAVSSGLGPLSIPGPPRWRRVV